MPTRRSVLRALAAAPALPALLGRPLAQAAPRTGARAARSFVTRPDLAPPAVEILTPASGTEPGHVLTTPLAAKTMNPAASGPRGSSQAGALIMDDAGQPVWFAPAAQDASYFDLKVQQYQGEPVLTHWEGAVHVPPGYGSGHYLILDEAYRPIAAVAPANGLRGDLHEFLITPRDTALLLAYDEVRADTTPVGGQPNSKVLEGVLQEIEIASGELLFEWRSLRHVGLDESFLAVPEDPEVAHDYIHLNAICEDGDALLVSARCTHAVYRIDRATGEIAWRLGGRRSDFTFGPDAAFSWQHDVRRMPDGTITLFDNNDVPPARGKSRALVLSVDETAKTANLVRSNESPEGLLAPNQGNAQLLSGGHFFVGWGGQPYFTEFDGDGKALLHARFTDSVTSYRAFRATWTGRPLDAPAVAGQRGNGVTSVYASWNGATAVATWRVLAGPDDQHLAPVQDAPRGGFETRVDIAGAQARVAVQALDAGGAVLATSPTVAVA